MPDTACQQDELLLVYDKQCPLCDFYCRMLSVKEADRLRLVDARGKPPILKQITARGIDIDQNMVLKIGDQLYAGGEAINQLALVTTPSSLFNRFNIWIFRSKRRAALLYPVLRSGRNLLLKLLGRTKINNLGLPDNERF